MMFSSVPMFGIALLIVGVSSHNTTIPDRPARMMLRRLQIMTETEQYNDFCWNNDNKEYSIEAKKRLRLERHAKHTRHGDVCRDPVNQAYICPRGCRAVKRPPFCVLKERGSASLTCHVNLSIPGGIVGGSLVDPSVGSASLQPGEMEFILHGSRVSVDKLPLAARQQDIFDLFSQFGDVKNVELNVDYQGKSTGAAVVTFNQDHDGANAVSYFKTRLLEGVKLDIKLDEAYHMTGPSIPVVASPIMMFNPKTGKPYQPGEAPSIWNLLFPSLTSARWVDPDVDIYIITNFIPHPTDMAELNRLNIKVLDMDQCFQYGRVKELYHSFSQFCPISGKSLGGSGIIGVTRFFAVQGAMEMLGIDMVFFFEGDNLLLRPISFLTSAYRIREEKIDATITHISFHTSFLGIEFLHQLNKQATVFGKYTKDSITKKCFLTGGGQDMRLGYEGAKMLQIQRQQELKNVNLKEDYGPNHAAMSSTDARILNTAGGTVPCELKARRWNNGIGHYCKTSGDISGPCALEEGLSIWHKNAGLGWDSNEEEYLPLLYECDPKSVKRAPATRIDRIPGSLQQNLKGIAVKRSPGTCKPTEASLCQGSFSDNVVMSETFYCDQNWVTKEWYNKALGFKKGRAFSQTPSKIWIEHYNLHFQGGGCKKQMEVVFEAIKRSAEGTDELSLNGFTCEGSPDLSAHEECMRSGKGAVPALVEAV